MKIEILKDYLGFGVAGNFTNHLNEAGEITEFSQIKTEESNAPKGLFPFYIKNSNSFLNTFPFSNKYIYFHGRKKDKLQAEPEVALICDFIYDGNKILDIIPKYFTAFNDCSLRVQNGKKLSTKKNWGMNTKGISNEIIRIDDFSENGVLSKYCISSFIKRNDKLYNYGTVSAVKSYSYFFDKLKNWMIEMFNTQKDCGPLEELGQFLFGVNKSKGLVIAAGATAYSEFGKRNYLESEDELFIYVYNSHKYSHNDILNDINNKNIHLEECSRLHQIVY